jgi:RNA polymerase sigma-70 factor (ECF subfamily)
VDVDDAPPLADEADTPAAVEHDRNVLKEALATALGRLSTDHRDVIELTFFHGCSYQEIAEIVGCPENTVKTRMFHARKQLKGHLAAAGLDPSSVEMAS